MVAVAGSDEMDKGEMYRLDQGQDRQLLGMYRDEIGLEGQSGAAGSCRADQVEPILGHAVERRS